MAGGSTLAVYAAITSNAIVTVAKFAGFAVTGSGSMLSEGVHSLADVGNQALLALGMKRANTPPDEHHPQGYGQEAFVWSMISAVGMFFLGCGVSITHGVQSLLDDGHTASAEHGSLNIGILLFALVVEGASLLLAVKGLRDEAKSHDQSFATYVRTTDDPFGVAVLFEDGAAVIGVLMALTAVLLSEWTGNPIWDPIGSIAIGVLLGLVAVFLIRKNRELLIGRAIRPEDRERLQGLLERDPAVQQVALQRAVVTGTKSYRIAAEIEFDGGYLSRKVMEGEDLTALHQQLSSPEALGAFLEVYGAKLMKQSGDEVDRIEAEIRTVLPKARHIHLEPD